MLQIHVNAGRAALNGQLGVQYALAGIAKCLLQHTDLALLLLL